MELIWVCWFIFGLVSGVIVSVWSMVKGKSDESGDQSDYFGLDDEAVKGILTVMRMSARYSEAERMAIDYCIDRLEGDNE